MEQRIVYIDKEEVNINSLKNIFNCCGIYGDIIDGTDKLLSNICEVFDNGIVDLFTELNLENFINNNEVNFNLWDIDSSRYVYMRKTLSSLFKDYIELRSDDLSLDVRVDKFIDSLSKTEFVKFVYDDMQACNYLLLINEF